MKSFLRRSAIAMLLSSVWIPLGAQDKVNVGDPVTCDDGYSGPLVGANWELCYRKQRAMISRYSMQTSKVLSLVVFPRSASLSASGRLEHEPSDGLQPATVFSSM